SGQTTDVEGFAFQAFSVRDGSGYFGMLESLGVVGLALFLLFLAIMAREFFRLRKLPAENLERAAGLSACVCFWGLAFNHIGEPWLLGPGSPISLVFWLCAAIMLTMGR